MSAPSETIGPSSRRTIDQVHDLTERDSWDVPQRKRAKPKAPVAMQAFAFAKRAFATMLHGSKRQGQVSWWNEFLAEAPAWLVSVVVHFLLVVILGLCAVGVQKKMAEMEVEVAPAYNFSDGDLGESLGSGLDDGAAGLLSEEFNPLHRPTPTISDSPNESEALAGAVSDLQSDWKELITSDDGNPSLMSGLGEGPFGPGGGGNGGEGNGVTSVFGLAGEGGKFVYAFDRSESMNSVFTLYSKQQILSSITPLKSAKMELIRSLSNLGSANRFQIIFYNDDPQVFGTQHYGHDLYSATAENKKLATEFVQEMKAEGFTNHLLALEEAFKLDPDVIFLMTDGEAKDDLLPAQVRRLYKYCLRRKILINVIHFVNAPRENCTLVRLAEKTGGQHVFIRLEDLAEAMIESKAEHDGESDDF